MGKIHPNRINKLNSAIKLRKQLLDRQEYSLLPENGGESVIFTSGTTREDKEVLKEHAEQLSHDELRGFLGATIIKQAKKVDIYDALQDKSISSLAFLGDGNMGLINLYAGNDSYERVTWYSLVDKLEHLKAGVMQERTCSMIKNPHSEVRIPLTSLIVVDQTKIFGTVDASFGNHAGYETFNNSIHQLFQFPNNSADQLRQPGSYRL